jgi:hypothetical protein
VDVVSPIHKHHTHVVVFKFSSSPTLVIFLKEFDWWGVELFAVMNQLCTAVALFVKE